MKCFKVVNHISEEVTIDTNKTNYLLTLPNCNKYNKLLDYITTSSKMLNLPLDMYFTINNNIALLGQVYIDNFPSTKNNVYRLSDFIFTNNNIYSKYSLTKTNLITIIQDIINIKIGLFEEGFYLWEYLYEKERKNINPPSRYKSFFLFDNKEDCEYYIKNHKGGGIICEVELLSTKTIFKGDMNLLDEIENYFTYNQAKEVIHRYWNGEKSENPVWEYLFQGVCKLKPIE